MYRDSDQEGLVFIELQVAEGLGASALENSIKSYGIRTENRRIDCGYMHIAEPAHYHRGYKTSDVWDQQLRLRIDYQSLAPAASDSQTYSATTTVKAFHAFVCEFSGQILQALLDSEGEVFNPITNEKRVPYPLHTSIPLQETWIRISDDEDALARVWDAEFKKLAGAVVPVKRWDNHDKTHRRPQNNIWAVIDREHTAALGMSTGVGLPPRLWEIIDIDMEYTFSDEQMSFLEPEPAVEPEQQAMDSLVAEIAAKREALSSYVLETSKEISSRSEEIARLEAQYKKHRHLDKRDRGVDA